MEKSNLLSKIDKEKAIKISHLVYAVLLIVLAITMGILFIVNVVDIYGDGTMASPFTVNAIESHFRAIAPVVIAFPCLVIVGFVLHFVFPLENKAKKIENDKALDTLSKKVNLDLVDLGTKNAVVRERYFRLLTILGSALIWLCALVIILVFTLNPLNYSAQKANDSVKDLALVIFPSAIISMGVSFAVSVVNKLSKKRELELLKSIIKQNKEALDGNGKSGLLPFIDTIFSYLNVAKEFFLKHENITTWVARGAVLIVAIALIVLGILNKGMSDVFYKAIAICTECIGLG